jgi:hypothetical protein
LADRFSNPVPDGTPVSFQAEGGSIEAQCLTVTTSNEGGVCSVALRSSSPRPVNGRVSIMATAIGEESFTDTNGNGVFDSGTDSYTDRPEPWLDVNENGLRDPDEPFYDFFVNQSYDAGNGQFNGVLCSGASCGPSRTLGIGARAVVIFSGSGAQISQTNGALHPAINLVVNDSEPLELWVRDANGNPMPAGTQVRVTASGAGLQVPAPNSDIVPSSTLASGVVSSLANGITVFRYTLTSGTTTGTGTLTVEVTSPDQDLVTRYQISVTVTP